jgi:phospholipase/carboxylesterase
VDGRTAGAESDRGAMSGAAVAAGAEPSAARMACVLVHGRDQDEHVMLDVVERLHLDDIAYLLPVSPERSWYPGRYFDPVSENEPHLTQAIEACEAALDAARDAGVAGIDTVLGGFSQGACVVAELLARRPRPLAGAAILTGSLLGRPAERTLARVDGLPMFFGLSRHDQWIALEDARATAEAFARAGASVTFEAYEDPEHHVTDEAVAGLRALLSVA